ncbi:hypothetical protein [Delftia sp. UME58]|uniref:hypothetical protein n=1 Tax=Delftia sp. UME58 TaxID=1862322 RepID=UPI001603DD88|nr:hypothetical protein [Delftia sp. UME58]
MDKRISDLARARRPVQVSDDLNKREPVKEINAEIEASLHRLNPAIEEALF